MVHGGMVHGGMTHGGMTLASIYQPQALFCMRDIVNDDLWTPAYVTASKVICTCMEKNLGTRLI